MAVEALRPPAPVGARGGLILAILTACAWAVWQLDLEFARLFPEGARLQNLKLFFLGAFSPDLSGTVLSELGHGIWRTIEFAVAAMIFALVIGVVLGFFASSAWWSAEKRGESTKSAVCFVCLRSTILPLGYILARLFIALFRSIHELFGR